MAYDIILAPEAVEDLQRLRANVRSAVRNGLLLYLKHTPTQVSKSRIKRLRGLRKPQYRLRIDDIRIYYDVRENQVEVLSILDKSETTIWLAEYGEPEEGNDDETDSTFGSEE
jgi:mRNA interferase RelE/StbE